jgi:hypothetical protein
MDASVGWALPLDPDGAHIREVSLYIDQIEFQLEEKGET